MGNYRDIFTLLNNNTQLNEWIHVNCGKKYNLMDYVMFLENSVLHTCHRDNNGDRFNDIKPNKSYTMIIYIDDMQECLDVIPKSHRHDVGIYAYDSTNTFLCNPGSIILFDANLIHSGSIFGKESNRRIQLKVSHDDDIEKLSFYQNYHKLMNKTNTNSFVSKAMQKHVTCQFPFVGDITQGNDKEYIKGNISPSSQKFSEVFYSDKNYYKLKDAF